MIIRWLDQAVEDLKAVRTYIARDNPSAAVAQRLRDAVKLLGDYPAAGRAGRVLMSAKDSYNDFASA